MVKQEFTNKAPQGYLELEEEDEALAVGNAFAGASDKSAHDRELWNALNAASIMGEEATNPSSIANAQLRMKAAFTEAGSKKKGGKDQGLSMEQIMMLERVRDLLDTIDERLAEIAEEREDINEKLETLDEIDELIANDDFDPVNNEDHRALMKAVDENLTDDQIDQMTPEQIAAWVAENRLSLNDQLDILNEEEVSLQDTRTELVELLKNDNNFPLREPFSVTNNQFDNELLEKAAQSLGDDFDRHNITEEQLEKLLVAIDADSLSTFTEKDSTLDALAEEHAEANDIIDINFEIKI